MSNRSPVVAIPGVSPFLVDSGQNNRLGPWRWRIERQLRLQRGFLSKAGQSERENSV